MKHLTTYSLYESSKKNYTLYERVSKETKIFESRESSEVISNIRDILRDCEDLGLQVSVVISTSRAYFIQISCVQKSVQVQFKDIRPNVDHLISYMKSIGYSNFNYVDTLSEFNTYSVMRRDEYLGEDVPRVANAGKIDNILPLDDDSRSSWIGIGKMMFTK